MAVRTVPEWAFTPIRERGLDPGRLHAERERVALRYFGRVQLDVVSWISLAIVAVIALAAAVHWLLSGHARHARPFRHARTALASLLLACFLLLGIEVFADAGVKEVVFDGWLDGVADSIDGTSDRDERIARHRQGSGRGSLVTA